MSGYTPLYDHMLTGTLFGRWPHTGIWACLLSRASREGIIDEVPGSLAAAIGVPVELLMQCIHDFMQPDPGSRTKEHDGRRLTLLDPDREWGWRVLNHTKYREKARKKNYDEGRTESGADADRKKTERDSRDVPTRPDASRDVPLSEASPEAEADKTHAATFAEVKRSYPKRSGSHRWGDAEKFLRKRIRENNPPETILAGVRRYAAYVKAEGIEGSSVVQQAATFLGDNRGFLEDWTPSAKAKKNPFKGSE